MSALASSRRSSRWRFRRSSSSRPSRCTCWSTPRSWATSARSPLGGLAVGGGLLAWSAALLNFLAYGTTARAARRAGAGDRAGAVAEGVQATWLALGLGVVVLLLLPAPRRSADPAARRRARSGRRGGGAVAAGRRVRRPAAAGLAGRQRLAARGGRSCGGRCATCWPAALLSLVLCPLLVHPVGLGLVGSAIANVAGQTLTAGLFLRALVREGVSWRPRPAAVRSQLVIGRDLLLRAAVLQLSFLVAAGVAARAGTAELGAHQIALQLFFFLALVLDAYAIAAQTLVGHALGGAPAGRRPRHRPPGGRSGAWAPGVAGRRRPARAPRRAAPAVHRRPRRPRRRPGWSGGSWPACSRWPAWSSPSTAS